MSLPAFQLHLESLKPHIADYDWLWKLLKGRARKTGWFPRRLHALLKPCGNPRKPYFIGQTGQGIRFLGDFRDEYAATCQVCPDYDAGLIRFMQDQVRQRPGNYLDLGANLGVTAATMARFLAPEAQVLAFEPIPDTARRAAATFALNQLDNVRLFDCAVGDTDEPIRFYAAPGHSEWASAHKTQQKLGIRWVEIQVACRTLDSLMEEGQLGGVSLLKVDVEGHEPKVVRGARRLLSRERPGVIFEYNSSIAPRVGWTPATVAQLLEASGDYRCQVLHPDNTLADFPFPEGAEGVYNIYAHCSATPVSGERQVRHMIS